jgi:DNA modification methylase
MNPRFQIINGDCREVLRTMADCSVDSVVCDPPYELGFMGKGWDRSGIAYDVSVWSECSRVLKPGGHLLAFGGSRTYHRLACAIEDAEFEIRDQIQWIYGSGFPKSLDMSKAIDAAAGAEREVIRERFDGRKRHVGASFDDDAYEWPETRHITAPASEAARQWNGWGTALKPAHEPIVLARKPLIGTVAENVLQHGTGTINIDGCRVKSSNVLSHGSKGGYSNLGSSYLGEGREYSDQGRWPANVIHDGSDEVLAHFPDTASGDLTGQPRVENKIYGSAATTLGTPRFYNGDSGSAARFFYCAKASQEDRNEGCEDLPLRVSDESHKRPRTELDDPRRAGVTPRRNNHPTVKPTDLMRYLCRLITPPGGVVLDPFCGSGSTGKAAMLEGLKFIGVELSAEYCELAQRRIEAVTKQGLLFAIA